VVLNLFYVAKKKIPDLDGLVEKAKQGDTDAFATIYDELVKPVYRYIYYRVEPTIAEDLTEEAFLKAWQNLRQYKQGKHPFSAWVFRIAHNLVVDHYRKNKVSEEIDDQLSDPSDTSNPKRLTEAKLNQIRLHKVIRRLPNNYQQVIILKYINELDNKEISKVIGKSETAIRTIQFRALEQLRSMLSDQRDDF